MIDPTVRFKCRLINHKTSINKNKIYEPCDNYLQEVYKLDQISMIGFMIEARGTITQVYENLRNQFGFESKLKDNSIVLTIKGFHQFIQNHFYNQNY